MLKPFRFVSQSKNFKRKGCFKVPRTQRPLFCYLHDCISRLCDSISHLCDSISRLCDNINRLCDNINRLCDNINRLCDNINRLCDNINRLCYRINEQNKTKSSTYWNDGHYVRETCRAQETQVVQTQERQVPSETIFIVSIFCEHQI